MQHEKDKILNCFLNPVSNGVFMSNFYMGLQEFSFAIDFRPITSICTHHHNPKTKNCLQLAQNVS